MNLLIGTYTEGTDALGIYAVMVSSEGSSQAIALDIPVRNPSFLAIHPSLPILYVVEELGEGEGGGLVSAFSWNGSGFSLLSRQSSLGEDPCHLSISPDGQLLAVANYSTGSVVVFTLDNNGGIQRDPGVIEHQTEFQNRVGEAGRHIKRQQQPHAHFSRWVGPRTLLVCDLGTDQVYRYDCQGFDQPDERKMISLVRSMTWTLPRGAGPRHAVLDEEMRRLWVLAELSNEVFCLSAEGDRVISRQTTIAADDKRFNEAAEIEWRSIDRTLWVSNRGADELVKYDVGPNSELTLSTRVAVPAYPRHFSWSDDDLWVACRDPGQVLCFRQARFQNEFERVFAMDVPSAVCVLPLASTPLGEQLLANRDL